MSRNTLLLSSVVIRNSLSYILCQSALFPEACQTGLSDCYLPILDASLTIAYKRAGISYPEDLTRCRTRPCSVPAVISTAQQVTNFCASLPALRARSRFVPSVALDVLTTALFNERCGCVYVRDLVDHCSRSRTGTLQTVPCIRSPFS